MFALCRLFRRRPAPIDPSLARRMAFVVASPETRALYVKWAGRNYWKG